METLYTRGLAPLPKTEESTRLTRVYRERYHWPLGFAVLCLVIEALLPECPRARRTEKAPAAGVLAQTAALLLFVLTASTTYGSPSSAYHDFQAGNFGDSFASFGSGMGPVTAVTVSVSAGNHESICFISCEDGPGSAAAPLESACGAGCWEFVPIARLPQFGSHVFALPASGTRYIWMLAPDFTASNSPAGESANPPQPKRVSP